MTEIVIVQGGQTGVDRGAWRAGKAMNLLLAGYMPNDAADEDGPIHPEVAADLSLSEHGLAGRTKQNLGLCTCLLVIVRDANQPYATPGTRMTLAGARERGKPLWVLDGDRRPYGVSYVARGINSTRNDLGPMLLMVAGPRASLWPEGHHTAFEVVHEVVKAIKAGW